jgi:hypothetical protein
MKLTITQHFEYPESSILHEASYDTLTMRLYVTFHDKKKNETETYAYDSVSPDVIDRWKTSKSKGSYFVEFIKDDPSIACTKVELPLMVGK